MESSNPININSLENNTSINEQTSTNTNGNEEINKTKSNYNHKCKSCSRRFEFWYQARQHFHDSHDNTIFNSKFDEIEKNKMKQWQFWKVSEKKLVNKFQVALKIDKDYYKSEDVNPHFKWLTYDYHKVPKNIGCIDNC